MDVHDRPGPGSSGPPTESADTAREPQLDHAIAVAATPAFRELIRNRNRFMIPAAAVSFGAYLLVISVSGFTTALSGTAVGGLSWTVVFTALLFPLVWLLCSLYGRRAARCDVLAEQAIHQASDGGARHER